MCLGWPGRSYVVREIEKNAPLPSNLCVGGRMNYTAIIDKEHLYDVTAPGVDGAAIAAAALWWDECAFEGDFPVEITVHWAHKGKPYLENVVVRFCPTFEVLDD